MAATNNITSHSRANMSLQIRKMLVVGAGQMGRGIAQVAVRAGLEVHLSDPDEVVVRGALRSIAKSFEREARDDRISEVERDSALNRISSSADYPEDVDIAIEAASEDFAIKYRIFQALDYALDKRAVLATNTSSISVTRIASATNRPEKVIGMHFSNPVPAMNLVEVVRGLQTNEATRAEIETLARRLGKTPVTASDSPGFVCNRLLMPMINEAVFCLVESVSDVEGIDAVMKLGMNHPMGPLELADLIGLDTCLAVMEVLHRDFGEDKYRPCPLLRRYVDAGRLGRKSGTGFYEYG